MYFAATGAVACMIAIWVLATSVELPPNNAEKLEAPHPTTERFSGKDVVIVGDTGNSEAVTTGTSTVPTFPKKMDLLADGKKAEYQLLGLGIRTVSFLRIQVYVAGLYVATEDLPALLGTLGTQSPPNTPPHALRALLLDADKSDEVWSRVLKAGGFRTLWRIVPTRSTDFMHLRDGWVRGITARSRAAAGPDEFDGEEFRAAVGRFKALFAARKTLPRGRTLLLMRDERGALEARCEGAEGAEGWVVMGRVEDERIGRLVWGGYLGGGKVSSEGVRASVVEGLVELVGR
jgi:hypothetical protein